MDYKLPLIVRSHEKGFNPVVTLHEDRIESTGWKGGTTVPVWAIQSVSNRVVGGYVCVSVATAAQTVAFQLRLGDSRRFQTALQDLIAKSHEPAATLQPAAATESFDLSSQLRELGELHASGVLSDDEFTAAKQRLLS